MSQTAASPTPTLFFDAYGTKKIIDSWNVETTLISPHSPEKVEQVSVNIYTHIHTRLILRNQLPRFITMWTAKYRSGWAGQRATLPGQMECNDVMRPKSFSALPRASTRQMRPFGKVPCSTQSLWMKRTSTRHLQVASPATGRHSQLCKVTTQNEPSRGQHCGATR